MQGAAYRIFSISRISPGYHAGRRQRSLIASSARPIASARCQAAGPGWKSPKPLHSEPVRAASARSANYTDVVRRPRVPTSPGMVPLKVPSSQRTSFHSIFICPRNCAWMSPDSRIRSVIGISLLYVTSLPAQPPVSSGVGRKASAGRGWESGASHFGSSVLKSHPRCDAAAGSRRCTAPPLPASPPESDAAMWPRRTCPRYARSRGSRRAGPPAPSRRRGRRFFQRWSWTSASRRSRHPKESPSGPPGGPLDGIARSAPGHARWKRGRRAAMSKS